MQREQETVKSFAYVAAQPKEKHTKHKARDTFVEMYLRDTAAGSLSRPRAINSESLAYTLINERMFCVS